MLPHLGQHVQLALVPLEFDFADVQVVHSPLELHDPPRTLLELTLESDNGLIGTAKQGCLALELRKSYR